MKLHLVSPASETRFVTHTQLEPLVFVRVGGRLYGTKPPPATYWALQNLGDPLLLLHHVEILPQVGRQGPAAEVALVHAVQVALPGLAAAGQGQGERRRRVPHVHQTHVSAARSRACPLESAGEDEASQLILQSGCQGNRFTRKKKLH